MIVKILDIKTNKTSESSHGNSVEWWANGNGSCDCNRVPNEEIEQELDKKACEENDLLYNEGDEPGLCYGSKRFLIIDIIDNGSEIIPNKEAALIKMNKTYDEELLRKYIAKEEF